MKFAWIVLMAAFSAVTYAEPVYRCEDGSAHIVYQGTPCPTPTSEAAAPLLADATAAWDSERPDPRRLHMQQEGLAIAIRVRARQAVSDDRDAARYAENRSRCATALRVAAACGKFAGTFYCDEKGFQPIPEAERVERPVPDSGAKYKMERCALDAASK
jgi:hypothetical protein